MLWSYFQNSKFMGQNSFRVKASNSGRLFRHGKLPKVSNSAEIMSITGEPTWVFGFRPAYKHPPANEHWPFPWTWWLAPGLVLEAKGSSLLTGEHLSSGSCFKIIRAKGTSTPHSGLCQLRTFWTLTSHYNLDFAFLYHKANSLLIEKPLNLNFK